MTKNDVDDLYESLKENDKVIAALKDRATEKGQMFNLRENVETILYEIRSASEAHAEWQPSKVILMLLI